MDQITALNADNVDEFLSGIDTILLDCDGTPKYLFLPIDTGRPLKGSIPNPLGRLPV